LQRSLRTLCATDPGTKQFIAASVDDFFATQEADEWNEVGFEAAAPAAASSEDLVMAAPETSTTTAAPAAGEADDMLAERDRLVAAVDPDPPAFVQIRGRPGNISNRSNQPVLDMLMSLLETLTAKAEYPGSQMQDRVAQQRRAVLQQQLQHLDVSLHESQGYSQQRSAELHELQLDAQIVGALDAMEKQLGSWLSAVCEFRGQFYSKLRDRSAAVAQQLGVQPTRSQLPSQPAWQSTSTANISDLFAPADIAILPPVEHLGFAQGSFCSAQQENALQRIQIGKARAAQLAEQKRANAALLAAFRHADTVMRSRLAWTAAASSQLQQLAAQESRFLDAAGKVNAAAAKSLQDAEQVLAGLPATASLGQDLPAVHDALAQLAAFVSRGAETAQSGATGITGILDKLQQVQQASAARWQRKASILQTSIDGINHDEQDIALDLEQAEAFVKQLRASSACRAPPRRYWAPQAQSQEVRQ